MKNASNRATWAVALHLARCQMLREALHELRLLALRPAGLWRPVRTVPVQTSGRTRSQPRAYLPDHSENDQGNVLRAVGVWCVGRALSTRGRTWCRGLSTAPRSACQAPKARCAACPPCYCTTSCAFIAAGTPCSPACWHGLLQVSWRSAGLQASRTPAKILLLLCVCAGMSRDTPGVWSRLSSLVRGSWSGRRDL